MQYQYRQLRHTIGTRNAYYEIMWGDSDLIIIHYGRLANDTIPSTGTWSVAAYNSVSEAQRTACDKIDEKISSGYSRFRPGRIAKNIEILQELEIEFELTAIGPQMIRITNQKAITKLSNAISLATAGLSPPSTMSPEQPMSYQNREIIAREVLDLLTDL